MTTDTRHRSAYKKLFFLMKESENQRIQFQGREIHQHFPSRDKNRNLEDAAMDPEFLGDGRQAQEVNINKGKSLKENVEVFLRRKNEAVGKLDELFEVLAAALVVELSPIVVRGLGSFVCMVMLVLMRLAMRAEVGGQAEAAQ